jgi:LytR cell envelope-related transcriptional attenuator
VDLIEQIGAFLGLAAFVGLAVLVLLYFQQARDVRRLREWAGRAPERAEDAAQEAAAAAAREAGVAPEEPAEAPPEPLRERILSRIAVPADVRDRLPEPRYLAIIAAGVVLVAAGVATGSFGLIGGDGDDAGGGGEKQVRPADVEVAVLNGTAASGTAGVPGLAETVSEDVKSAGDKVGAVTDAGSFADTFVMYTSGHTAEAEQVADDLKKQLDNVKVERMTPEVEAASEEANVAVVIGLDNSQL